MTRLATMTCRDALDVLVDDPDRHSPQEVRRARAHLGTCLQCANALDDRDAPDRVLASLARHRPEPSTLLRLLLVVFAVAQLVVASPWLFGATLVPAHHVSMAHLTRDGALGLVIAAIGLLVAWRPRYWLAAVLIGSIVLTLQVAAGVIDDRDRYVNSGFELMHLLIVAIMMLIAFVSTTSRRATPDARPDRDTLRAL